MENIVISLAHQERLDKIVDGIEDQNDMTYIVIECMKKFNLGKTIAMIRDEETNKIEKKLIIKYK